MTIYEFFSPLTGERWFNLVDQYGQLVRTTAPNTVQNCLDDNYLVNWHMVNCANLQNYFSLLRSEALNLLD